LKSGNAFVRGAANGWQISGITQVQSGQQLLNSSSGQARNFNLQQGGTNQDNVHLLGSPDITIFPLSCAILRLESGTEPIRRSQLLRAATCR